jgi:hypothetical protein
VRLELSHGFIRSARVRLDPEDLRLGLSMGLVSPSTVISIAGDEIALGSADPVLLDLTAADRDDIAEVRRLLRATDPYEAELFPPQAVRKWLYLELKAAFEMREALRDPLGLVEAIYADFDYPPAVAAFVRYMPPPDGEPVGVDAMYDRWSAYLTAEAAALAGG